MDKKPLDPMTKRIKAVYDIFDVDHDGDITAEEFSKVLKSLGYVCGEDKIQELVTSVDADGSGTISFDEFLTLFNQQKKSDKVNEELAEAFSVFDRDGNGYISSTELKFALRTICPDVSEEEANEIILAGDSDGDGLINYEEFVRLISPQD